MSGGPDADDAIPLEPPFDLRGTLRRTTLWGSDPTQRLAEDACVVALRTPEGPATVAYAPEPPGRVVVRAWGPGAAEAVRRAAAHLGADDPSAGFAHPHPIVGPLLRRARGLRFGRTGRVFDRLVAVVLGQKVASVQASQAYRGLVERCAEPAPGPFGLLLPPSPERLRELDYGDLHRLNVERRRAETILGLARRAARLDALAALDPREAEDKLLSLPNVGPWTAAHVVSAALGATDAVPVGDWHFPHHVASALTGAPRGTDDELLAHLEPFRPHRGRALLAILLGAPSAPRFGPKMALRDFRRQ